MKIFEIQDDRKFLYQWDLNRKLEVNDTAITEVHFCRSSNGTVYAKKVDTSTSPRTVLIPNELLQQHGTIKVYAYADIDGTSANQDEYTKAVEFFDVIAKPKPEDYNYDVAEGTWANFNARLNTLETNDTTQGSALTAHGAAISALQAKDVAHDTALSALDTTLTTQIQSINEELNRQQKVDTYYDKRLTNLEEKISDDGLIVDDEVSYTKAVPDNVCPYASVDIIGGYSKKSKNLLHFPDKTEKAAGGLTWSSKNGAITAKGTITGASYSSDNSIVCLLPIIKGRTYYRRFFDEQNGDNAVKTYISITPAEGSDFYINASTHQNKYTVIGDEKKIRVYFGFANSDHADEGREIDTTFYPMMSVDDTDDYKVPYEPYFEGFRSAAVTEVESVGANLIPYPYYFSEGERNGLTFTFNQNRSITINGTVKADNGIPLCQFTKPKIFKSGKYYSYLGEELPTGCSMYSVYSGEHYYWCQAGKKQEIRTLSQDISITTIRLWFKAGAVFDNVTILPMLVKSDTEAPYTPYRRNTIPIPEAIQSLDGYGRGIDDTYYNYIDWEKRQFVKWVEKREFNGTENIHTVQSGKNRHARFEIGSYGTVITGICLCNKLDQALIGEKNENIGFQVLNSNGYNNAQINFRWAGMESQEKADIKAQLKQWYDSGSPMVVYYALSTPEIIDISDILAADNLIEVEGGGTITAVNEFYYDTPNTITYLKKEVDQ